MGKFVTFAIAAIAVDLIWGYGGMLSLGQVFRVGWLFYNMYLKLTLTRSWIPDL